MTESKTSAEYAPDGTEIYTHTEPSPQADLAEGIPHTDEITAHIEKYIGPVSAVWHEIVSEIIHLDVCYVAPAESRPYHALITSGMSDLPMHTPNEVLGAEYGELVLLLPKEWQVSREAFGDDQWYWPIGVLKMLARLPHMYNTWLGVGHTIPNYDPPMHYHALTELSGMILLEPALTSQSFAALQTQDELTIHFYQCTPLYSEEMDMKLKKGLDVLLQACSKKGVDLSLPLDIERKNVAKKRFWFF